MADADRVKWDARYREGHYAERNHPSALLAEWEPRLPRGRALDVACGAGRNALFLAATGRQVDAIDISAVGLEQASRKAGERGLEVRWLEADLELEPPSLPAGPYDLIVMVRFVSPRLLPYLLARLSRGGVFLCEQHLESTEEVIGPRGRFRLRANQLLEDVLAHPLPGRRLHYYREGPVTEPDGRPAALAQMILEKGALRNDGFQNDGF